MSDKEVTVKVFQFSSSEKWLNWKEVFLARLNKKDANLSAVFDLDKEFKMTKTEGDKDVPDKNQESLMASAYNELLLSMNFNSREGENAFNLIKWSKDNKGRGDAREAWKRLIDRYEPKTFLEKGKLMKEFYSATCGYKEDPVQFIYQLENIRLKIHNIAQGKVVINDRDFMNQVLNSLPLVFESLAENLLAMVDQDKDPLTISGMIQEISAKTAKLKLGKRGNNKNSEEIALVGFNNQFKGKCNYCGKIGHKGANCFEKNKQKDKKKPPQKFEAKKGKFVPTCYNCGEKGHKKPECPKLVAKRDPNHAYAAVSEDIAFTALESDWSVVSHKKRKKAKNTWKKNKIGHSPRTCTKKPKKMPGKFSFVAMSTSDEESEDSGSEFEDLMDLDEETKVKRKYYTRRKIYEENESFSNDASTETEETDRESALVAQDNPWDKEEMKEAENEEDDDERERAVARVMIEMYKSGNMMVDSDVTTETKDEDNKLIKEESDDNNEERTSIQHYLVTEECPSHFEVHFSENGQNMSITRFGRRYPDTAYE